MSDSPMMTNAQIFNLEQTAEKLSVASLIERLSAILGPKLTAYLAGANDISVLGDWSSGKAKADKAVRLRLMYGYIAAAILARNYDVETAKAAFLGMDQYLGDEAPAAWLRKREKADELREVIAAARNFGEMCG